MANESAPARAGTGFEQFQQEFAECWRLLPFKALFLVLLGAWSALFHFLGNSTLGYTNTPSIFSWLDWIVKRSEDDQHVPWVVVAVVALLWWKRREIMEVPKRNWWPALIVLGAAILLHALGYMVQQTRISLLAFFLGIYGIVGVVWGPQMIRSTFFPIFLFSFCVPMGGTLVNSMTLPLRIMATKITGVLCHGLLGINVIQDGTRLFDANHTYSFEVGVACSGIRSLTATLALALVYGFMMFKSPWRRLSMLAATIPLAIAANVFRLTVIVITSEVFGKTAGLYVHESWWISLIPYMPMIGGILLVGRWLRERPSARLPSGEQASWSSRELGAVFSALAGILVLPEFIPVVKAWSQDHQYTSVLGLVTVAIVCLGFLSRKKNAIPGMQSNTAIGRCSSFVSPGTTAVALLLLAGTAVGLQYTKTHQKLGSPGVRVAQETIYDLEGKLAGTNSVALPERVLNFESTVIPVDRVVLDLLPKDTTYGQRLYKAADGFQTQINVVLMGADRTSIHKPQYCLTGIGWQIDQSEIESISINQPHDYQLPVNKLTVSRLATEDDGAKTKMRGIYVYWFVAENRLTAYHGQRMLDMGLEMLRTGVLQRWAYVSCFAVCYPGQEQATYVRIKELISAAVPEFQLTTGETATLARNP